jgi:glucose/arabinose dehydrogenase
MSKKVPGLLLVSRGSDGNLDPQTRSITSGVSQIRLFNVSGVPKEVKYVDGKVIGWGLRNSVGLGENPKDGGIWSNENSSDWMGRDEGDIHEDSPGEEINYHGDLLGKSEMHGKNYGYPECAAVWRVDNLPHNSKLKVGLQFTHNGTAAGITDDTCAKNFVSPRITLPSHWAPLDIEFNTRGDVAYMTAHGSWSVLWQRW